MCAIQFEPTDTVIGVDTHRDFHVAVSIDGLGRRISERTFDANRGGYSQLLAWAKAHDGPVTAVGVEGTGSYGAGLARHLRQADWTVIEVDRPERKTRRRGKDDALDAEAAARSVLAGTATTEPKSGDGSVEMLRILKIARDSAVRSSVQATNQIKAIVVTAPEPLRAKLRDLTTHQLVARCAAMRPRGQDVTSTTKTALRSLARRVLALKSEAAQLAERIDKLTIAIAPELRSVQGLGPDTTATILIAAGDNPHRLRTESAFAALCGTSPIPASSGNTTRHRLNRGGNRQANAALHRIVLVRLQRDARTKDYVNRRTAEGKTKAEIMRCLKRYIAREIYPLVSAASPC